MQSQKILELSARLDQVHKLTNAERVALVRDLERYAAQDLYGAARLCKDHLHKETDLRLPSALQAAPLVAKHFELRMTEQRRAIDLHHELDKQLRQPEPGREYVGPVVGTTPNCVVQMDNDTGDLIVHSRSSLVCAFEPEDKDKSLSIHYPQAAIGGVGLVTRMQENQGMTLEHGLTHEASASKPERSTEHGL